MLKTYTMKQILLVLIAATVLCGAAAAQSCANYLLLQNNKRIEMTVYNKKGKENGKQVWNVSDVKKNGGTTTGKISSEFFNEKGKSLNKATNEIKCTGGVYYMNMKMMLSEGQQTQLNGADVKADGGFLEYPAAMTEGDALKDGELKMEFTMNGGLKSTMELSVTNRKVGGKESVTSPAGTWECIKITSSQKITTRMGGIGIPIKMDITEWYAPGVGVIKTESKYGSTLITAIQ